ncbi:MAG: hypothetical protein KF819_13185 [Labilithrix sp.]|nr:hypothetical protein [Labilithrix sp.]
MIARVLREREDARVALAVAAISGGGLALVLIDDMLKVASFSGPGTALYALVAALIALAGVAPWLAWTVRGRATQIRCEPGKVHVDGETIQAGDVTALGVARALGEGARGRSVAVARGRTTIFIEVERAEDAARLVEALGGERGERASSELPSAPGRSRALAAPQIVIALVSVAFGPLYFAAATASYAVLSPIHDAKAFFGLGGVVAAFVALALLVVRRLLKSQAVALRRGAYDAHVALHHQRSKASETSDASPDEAPLRAHPLARGDEPVGAWLSRLDALPVEAHAYRGDAMKKDVLWETLGDVEAPVDARMAAARVLSRRYGEEEGALVRIVAEPEVRLRVEAVLEGEHDDAERRIETLGPLFTFKAD